MLDFWGRWGPFLDRIDMRVKEEAQKIRLDRINGIYRIGIL